MHLLYKSIKKQKEDVRTIFSRAEPPLSLIGCSRGLNSVSREATPANSCSSKFFICSSSSL